MCTYHKLYMDIQALIKQIQSLRGNVSDFHHSVWDMQFFFGLKQAAFWIETQITLHKSNKVVSISKRYKKIEIEILTEDQPLPISVERHKNMQLVSFQSAKTRINETLID
jgi:hypothetical protein